MADTFSASALSLGWNLIIQSCEKEIPSKGAAFSPLSINFALGMLAGGADPESASKITSKLGIKNPEELNALLSSLLHTFNANSKDNEPKILSISNAVFADKTFSLYPDYIKHVAIFQAYVKGGFETLPQGTGEINEWIEKNTNGLIKNMLIPANLLGSPVALVNTLAFKGVWKTQFDPKKTKKDYPFKVTEQSTNPVDMMFLESPSILVHFATEYVAIRLPYKAASKEMQMSFIAYLPLEGKTLEEILPLIRDGGIPTFHLSKLTALGFPKIKMNTSQQIFGNLLQLDYPLNGNFSRMGTGPTQVGNIIHNVVIDLDEKGTEAAAATVVVMRRSRPMHIPPSVIFDRPFAFSIIIDAGNITAFAGIFTPV